MRNVRMTPRRVARRQRGSIMILVAVLMSSMALLSLGMVMMISTSNAEQRGSREDLNVVYVCEAGLSAAVFELNNDGDGAIGSQDQPVAYSHGSYWVEATDLGNNTFALRSTGMENRSRAVVELTVRAESQSLFRWSAFGDEGATMDSNAHVDSYDSRLGDYLSQRVNADDSNRWALENGDVGSNQAISLSSNSGIHGDATPGPNSTTTITGNAEVSGSTLPALDTVDLPPLVVPAVPNSGDLIVASNTTLNSGSYGYGTLLVNGNKSLTIRGPATIVTSDFYLNSNAQIIVDPTNGPVEFFVLNDFIISSHTSIASTRNDPADIAFNLLSDNIIDPSVLIVLDDVVFDSNAMMYATIFAPDARIDIDSNFELFGALIARRVHLDSNCLIHYDEALMEAGGGGLGDFERICWRIVGDQ